MGHTGSRINALGTQADARATHLAGSDMLSCRRLQSGRSGGSNARRLAFATETVAAEQYKSVWPWQAAFHFAV